MTSEIPKVNRQDSEALDVMPQSGARSSLSLGFSPSTAVDAPQTTATGERLDIKGLITLCALRFSSAWGERSSAFATYLFLVIIFPSTLVPASIFGFCSTAAGIVFSNWAEGLVDKHGRLSIVRWTTTAQKLATAAIYSLLLVLLLVPASRQPGSAALISCMAIIVLCGCVEKVSTICLAVSIEREWPSIISQGSSDKLTTMNTWLRRTDLVCDLIAPLFVSALSAGVSYHFAAAFLIGMTILCFALEIFLCGVTHRLFPQLHHQNITPHVEGSNGETPSTSPRTPLAVIKNVYHGLSASIHDIVEFSRLPVFYTSLSIASIYLTVLSFDGTMLTYLKNSLNYGDPFLAGQKAVSTVAGLLGTILFPFVMHKIGLVRTGSWSIWFEFSCLIPVVVSLQLVKVAGSSSAPDSTLPHTQPISPGLAAALFGGMALSRIGLWMFDLSQLQILQESLESHPRRNRLTSIQFTLQNVFDMAKFALTIGLAKPSQFRWAGLVSVGAVFVGGLLYIFGYARRVRGHIAPHWKWLEKFKVL